MEVTVRAEDWIKQHWCPLMKARTKNMSCLMNHFIIRTVLHVFYQSVAIRPGWCNIGHNGVYSRALPLLFFKNHELWGSQIKCQKTRIQSEAISLIRRAFPLELPHKLKHFEWSSTDLSPLRFFMILFKSHHSPHDPQFTPSSGSQRSVSQTRKDIFVSG